MSAQSSTLKRQTARVFVPLIEPRRYKGAKGGRGSGKSHDRAESLIEDHILNPGLDSVCIREIQKSLSNSSKKVISEKIASMGVSHICLLYTSPSPRDQRGSRMPSSA